MVREQLQRFVRTAYWVLLLNGLFVRTQAHSQSSPVAPDFSLAANGSAMAQSYQGWPLIFDATLSHPQRFARSTSITPLLINAQNGSWANTTQLQITDSNGVAQTWPIQLATVPPGDLSLDAFSHGRLIWLVAPSAASAISPGSYNVIGLLDTTKSASATGWNGTTTTFPITVQIGIPPSSPTIDQQEEQAELLAMYDSWLGNNSQALADINSFLSQQPNAIGSLALKGDLLDQMGQATDALAAYNQALSIYYTQNPDSIPDEPPARLLVAQKKAQGEVLTQTGVRGQPQVAIQAIDQGMQSPGVFFVDLRVTDVGNDVAVNVSLNQVTFQTVSGTGQVTFNSLLSPRFPVGTDFLAVNDSATIRFFVTAQGAVNSFLLTENGTAADIFGTSTNFTQTQNVALNTGGGPVALAIAASNATQVYGQSIPDLNNVTYTGFANGDSPASLDGTLTCATTATQGSPVGTYPITCSGLSSPSYTITFLPGTLTITTATLTVTANDASRQYGQANPPFAASYSGFVNGDGPSALSGMVSCTTMATTSSPVGTYPITCSGLSSTNYSITYTSGQLTVVSASLTVTANDASRPYGQANPTFAASYSGFVNSDSSSVLSGTLICATTATASSPAGTYPITCTGLTSTNYTIAYAPGQLTVTSPALTVTANNASRPYGQANPSFGAGFSGFVNGDSASSLAGTLVCTSPATPSSSQGTYPIACSGLTSTNYTIAYASGQLTVTSAALAVTANSGSRLYGQANPAFGATFDGFVNGDTASTLSGTLVCTSPATPGSSPGTYPISCSGLTSPNYTITYGAGQLAVTAAALTITANNASRQFGQVNPAFTASYSGFANGDTASSLSGALVCSTAATASSTAGTYPINCSGLTSSNYVITYMPGQLTVTPPPCAQDVSASLTAKRSGFSYSPLSKRYAQTLTLTNVSGAALTGPLYVVLDTLSTNASVSNASGSTVCAVPMGSPYISVNGTLNPGSAVSVVVQFADPSNAAISYALRILAGSGQP